MNQDFLKHKKKFFVAIIIIAGLVFLNFKTYSDLFSIKANILSDKILYDQLKKSISGLEDEANKKEYEDLLKDKDSSNILNYDGQVKFLLKEIEKITIDSGLTLNSINFNPKIDDQDKKDNSIKKTMFNINILGTYDQLKNWLIKIHELKITSINRIIFSITDIQKPTNFQVELKMYYR